MGKLYKMLPTSRSSSDIFLALSLMVVWNSLYVTGSGILTVEENVTTIRIGDKIQRQEINLYAAGETYKFELDDISYFCNSFGKSSHGKDCYPLMSLSLLHMSCNNNGGESKTTYLEMSVLSSDKSNHRPHPKRIPLCMNYTYLYTNMNDEDHENLDEFKSLDGFKITTVGQWGPEDTRASILVSIHYNLVNKSKECPSDFYDCSKQCKENPDDPRAPELDGICIPRDWICDKRPNCGICGDADESEALCDWDWENGNSDIGVKYASAFILLLDVVCFGIIPLVVVIVVLKYAFRAARTPRLGHRNARRGSPDPAPTSHVHRRKDSDDLPPSYGDVVVDVSTVTSGSNGSEQPRPNPNPSSARS